MLLKEERRKKKGGKAGVNLCGGELCGGELGKGKPMQLSYAAVNKCDPVRRLPKEETIHVCWEKN